jgi:hypothetical protein
MSSQNYVSNEGPHGRIRSPIRRLVSFLANILTHCLLPTGTVPSVPTAIGGVTEDPVTRGHSVRVGEESGEEQGQRRCFHSVHSVIAGCSFPTTSGSSALTRIDVLTESPVMGEHFVRVKEESGEEQGQRGCLHSVHNIVAGCLFPIASALSALARINDLTKCSVMGEHSVHAKEEPGEEQGQRTCLQSIRNVVARRLLLTASVSSALTRIDGPAKGSASVMGEHPVRVQEESDNKQSRCRRRSSTCALPANNR